MMTDQVRRTDAPELVDFDEACAIAGVSKSTGERLLRAGDWPKPFRLGRRRLYRAADIARWLNAKAEAALAA